MRYRVYPLRHRGRRLPFVELIEPNSQFTGTPSHLLGPPSGRSSGAISGALALVPEPSTYLWLLVGFGFLGLAFRRSALRTTSI
jgi:PEP-CTERM motif